MRKKYKQFQSHWLEHECYNKLRRPSTKLGLIDNVVVFPYPYVRIEKTDNGELKIKNPSLGSNISFIDYDKFTVEFIHKLCTFRPQSLLGEEITTYQEEIVPLFLSHLKEVLPDKYKEFTSKYEGFPEKIDYVGRKALLKTIKPSYVHYKSDIYPKFNEEWYWDGEFLTYKKGYVSGFNVTNDYEIEEIKIKPSDKSVIRISSNEQVTEHTVFVD